MISFNFSCDQGHSFEGWFSSSADFDDQQQRGLVACPVCNSTSVIKTLMSPNVAAKSSQQKSQEIPVAAETDRTVMSNQVAQPQPESQQQTPQNMTHQVAAQVSPEMTPQMQKAMGEAIAEMRKLQKTVETHCDDVGDGFAEEARKIHYGEAKPRGIYGRTTDEEAESLVDEGIEITKMPWLPKEQ
jgi:hypothetical protein